MSVGTYLSPHSASSPVLSRPDRHSWFPAVLYLVFAIADLLFSLIAFRFGIAEGNPFMAWLVANGLFVPGKIFLTLLVTALMVVVYSATRRWRWTVWSGVYLMAAVVVYHMWALPQVAGLTAFFPFS